jgi:hypothetical protein
MGEVQSLFLLMIRLFEVLLTLRRKKSNSSNTHMPPSQDPFREKPKKPPNGSGKGPGGQKGHPGHSLGLDERPDEVIFHPAIKCKFPVRVEF